MAIILLAAMILVYLFPLFMYMRPPYLTSPDLIYAQAKTNWVMAGHIYTDPITGLPSFHPPFYHILISPLRYLGISYPAIFFGVIVFCVAGFFILSYKIVELCFSRMTALYTALLLPFGIHYMGARMLHLPDSFHFSIPFYLLGLWLYLKSGQGRQHLIWIGILWGLAFLISPGYFFLIGFTFVYELAFVRKWRRAAVLIGTFAIAVIPFAIQAIYLHSRGMAGSDAFAFWRGFPNYDWLAGTFSVFFEPAGDQTVAAPVIRGVILVLAVVYFIRSRKVPWFVLVALVAFLFTVYHFSVLYALRINLFLSIFILAAAVSMLLQWKPPRWIMVAASLAILGFSLYGPFGYLLYEMDQDKIRLARIEANSRYLDSVLPTLTEPGDYILCDREVYRYYILAQHRLHGLSMYRSLTYFQLPREVAEKYERDYETAVASRDYNQVSAVAHNYGIKIAVVMVSDDLKSRPLATVMREHGMLVHKDRFFLVYRFPDQAPS